MAKRKPLSKSVRFEVFKRDSFTCQYCGRSAPEVVLEVDHIIPVSKGGTDELLNLVTSCRDCNRGKSAKRLSDDSTLVKQKAQLDELNEKREQMEMMIEWKKSLLKLIDSQVEAVEEMIVSLTGYGLTDHGRQRIRKLISEFGFAETYTATEISFNKYYRDDRDYTWETAFKKIGGVCFNRRKYRDGVQEDR